MERHPITNVVELQKIALLKEIRLRGSIGQADVVWELLYDYLEVSGYSLKVRNFKALTHNNGTDELDPRAEPWDIQGLLDYTSRRMYHFINDIVTDVRIGTFGDENLLKLLLFPGRVFALGLRIDRLHGHILRNGGYLDEAERFVEPNSDTFSDNTAAE